MTREQIEACAARLPALERAEFVRLHREAGELIAEGWRLRFEAWRIYQPYKPKPRPA